MGRFRWVAGCVVALPLAVALVFSLFWNTTDSPTEGQRTSSVTSEAQPNIVYVVTDDMRKDDLEKMLLTKAAVQAQGMTFENTVIADSQCCPSRATTLTGQYVHNHQVKGNNAPAGGASRYNSEGHNTDNIAVWLRGAGYTTALVGKYLNEYTNTSAVPAGWDEWYAKIGQDYYGYRMNENGRKVRYGSQPEDYSTDVIAGHAADFVSRKAPESAPFFLYVAPTAPHRPNSPAPRHKDLFEGTPATSRSYPSFDEADVSDKPGWVRNLGWISDSEAAAIDEEAQVRWEMLQSVDEMVASLVEDLQAAGELENTYIFFTSDNGWHLGEHRFKYKKNAPYEESVEVPLVVRGPGIAVGSTDNRLVSNVDFAPTWLTLAGASLPDQLDGRSLKPLLDGSTVSGWRTRLLFEYYGTGNSPVPAYFAFRSASGPEKYVRLESGTREHYDLADDPYELANDYASLDAAKQADLGAKLDALVSCADQSCRDAEQDAP